jgi:hypothetical protein
MNKKEFSYIVFSSSGDNAKEIVGVYKDLDGASYGARLALSTLFPKHGDKAEIIRCEVISSEEAQIEYEKTKPTDIFEKCEDGFCPMPTLKLEKNYND